MDQAKKRKLFTIAIPLTLLALPTLYTTLVYLPMAQLKNYKLKQKLVPTQVLSHHPALIYPLKRYETQGNKYLWGKNDCSTFVSDYIKALRKPLFKRLTTQDLYEENTMAWLGYNSANPQKPSEGDIVVYRYMGKYKRMAGHTGIVFKLNGEFSVLHNSLSHGGIVITPYNSFYNNGKKLDNNIKLFTQ